MVFALHSLVIARYERLAHGAGGDFRYCAVSSNLIPERPWGNMQQALLRVIRQLEVGRQIGARRVRFPRNQFQLVIWRQHGTVMAPIIFITRVMYAGLKTRTGA